MRKPVDVKRKVEQVLRPEQDLPSLPLRVGSLHRDAVEVWRRQALAGLYARSLPRWHGFREYVDQFFQNNRFAMKSSMPASMHRARLSMVAWAVMAMIVTDSLRCLGSP
jgi:hypothetical protein